MDSDSILEELQSIFRDVLYDQPDLNLTRESNGQNVEDWDLHSTAHINLAVTAVASKYKIRFALGELQDLKDVGDMIDLIEMKVAAK